MYVLYLYLKFSSQREVCWKIAICILGLYICIYKGYVCMNRDVRLFYHSWTDILLEIALIFSSN